MKTSLMLKKKKTFVVKIEQDNWEPTLILGEKVLSVKGRLKSLRKS